jgi:hypothetical protein
MHLHIPYQFLPTMLSVTPHKRNKLFTVCWILHTQYKQGVWSLNLFCSQGTPPREWLGSVTEGLMPFTHFLFLYVTKKFVQKTSDHSPWSQTLQSQPPIQQPQWSHRIPSSNTIQSRKCTNQKFTCQLQKRQLIMSRNITLDRTFRTMLDCSHALFHMLKWWGYQRMNNIRV